MFNKDMRMMLGFTVICLAVFALVVSIVAAPGHIQDTTANALTGPTPTLAPTPDAQALCNEHLDSIKADRSIKLSLDICTLEQVREYVEND